MNILNRPLVSIITPCYNGEEYLDRYFDSILKQTYPNLELIFVNDGSSDKTEEIALSYKSQLESRGIQYTYLYQDNAGQAAALNRGLKLFKGDYLTWPDSDDTMTPDCIEKKVDYLESHSELDMCICKGISVLDDASNKQVGILERVPPKDKETFFEDLIYIKNVFFVPGGYMVRSTKIDSSIKQREIYAGPGGQNAQLLLPVSYDGKIGYLNESLFVYYIRDNSHSHGNTTARELQQVFNYETIILETLKLCNNDVYHKYALSVMSYYSKWQYGISIGLKDKQQLKLCFRKYSKYGSPSIKERIKYLIKCLTYR